MAGGRRRPRPLPTVRRRVVAAIVAAAVVAAGTPLLLVLDGPAQTPSAAPSFRQQLGAVTSEQARRLEQITVSAQAMQASGDTADTAALYQSLRDAAAQAHGAFLDLEPPPQVETSTDTIAQLFAQQVTVLDGLIADTAAGSPRALDSALAELRLIVERTTAAQAALEADLVRCGADCA